MIGCFSRDDDQNGNTAVGLAHSDATRFGCKLEPMGAAGAAGFFNVSVDGHRQQRGAAYKELTPKVDVVHLAWLKRIRRVCPGRGAGVRVVVVMRVSPPPSALRNPLVLSCSRPRRPSPRPLYQRHTSRVPVPYQLRTSTFALCPPFHPSLGTVGRARGSFSCTRHW